MHRNSLSSHQAHLLIKVDHKVRVTQIMAPISSSPAYTPACISFLTPIWDEGLRTGGGPVVAVIREGEERKSEHIN